MSDTSGKRAPKPFEPPPWERDAFEELKRKREADEAAAREREEAQAQVRAAEAIKAQAAAAKADKEDPVVKQARLLAAAELAKEQGVATATSVPAAEQGATTVAVTIGEADADAATATTAMVAGSAEEGVAPVAPRVDDRKVAEMLAVLSVQEPKTKSSGTFGLVAAIVLVVLGVGMMIVSVWWQMAGPKTGAAPTQLLLQSMLVGGFGLGFTVVGGLIGYQSRQQARS